jgi:SAM-dependent methyltransferase
MESKPIVKGLASWLPLSARILSSVRAQQTAGYWSKRHSARYCYGVWLKHLTLLHRCGMAFPESIAELGPGDTIGVGIAALLSGVQTYHAFDVRPFTRARFNAALVDELAEMLRQRLPRPRKGWPDFDHELGPTLFPDSVLTPARIDAALQPDRVLRLRRTLGDLSNSTSFVRYVAPWGPTSADTGERYDLVFSHTVLEYVDDLHAYFSRCARMLKPGGWMSHQVDLSSLGITRRWNAHLAYPSWVWRIVAGRRAHRPNRKLPADYQQALHDSGFALVWSDRLQRDGGIPPSKFAREFRDYPQEDVGCGAVFVIARLASAGSH